MKIEDVKIGESYVCKEVYIWKSLFLAKNETHFLIRRNFFIDGYEDKMIPINQIEEKYLNAPYGSEIFVKEIRDYKILDFYAKSDKFAFYYTNDSFKPIDPEDILGLAEEVDIKKFKPTFFQKLRSFFNLR